MGSLFGKRPKIKSKARQLGAAEDTTAMPVEVIPPIPTPGVTPKMSWGAVKNYYWLRGKESGS